MRINGFRLYLKKYRKEERKDRYIIFALCSILFIPSINNFANTILQTGLSVRISLLTPVSYIFMALMSGLFLYKLIFKNKLYFFVLLFFLAGSIISYSCYPEIRQIIYSNPVDLVYSPVNKLVFFCIPSLFGIMQLKNYEELFNKMHDWGRLTVSLGIFSYYFVVLIMKRSLQYMVYSYFMLLPICACLEYGKVKNSKIDTLLGCIGGVCITICGARGAVLSLILFLFIQFLSGNEKKNNFVRIFYSIILIFAFFIILLFRDELISSIYSLFNKLGINSRFISALSLGLLLEDSGRTYISDTIFKGIIQNPLGYGLYGDRYVTGFFGDGRYRYAHNILVELFCDFGVAIGSALIIILIYKIARLMLKRSCKSIKEVFYVLIPYGLFQLFFSSSYLENPAFFMIVGLLFIKGKKDS